MTEKSKRLLMGMIGLNIVIYLTLLIPLAINSETSMAVCSVPLVALYNIVEMALFFLDNEVSFNWPCTPTVRVFIILHDLAYFITYAAFYGMYDDGFTLATCIFFSFTFALRIAILAIYSRLPSNSSCCPSQARCLWPFVTNNQPPAYSGVRIEFRLIEFQKWNSNNPKGR